MGKDYHTLGISENSLFSEALGFDQVFDGFQNIDAAYGGGKAWKEIWEKDEEFSGKIEKYLYFAKKVGKYRDLESITSLLGHFRDKIDNSLTNPGLVSEVIENALEELKSPRNSFIFANVMPVHYPYTFSEDEKAIYLNEIDKDLVTKSIASYNHEDYLVGSEIEWSPENLDIRKKGYWASIKYVDREIKKLYDESPEDTLFVVLGDHGELFGEHKVNDEPIVGHHFGTFEELIHVPFIAFSKSSISLELDQDSLFDHTNFHEIILSLVKGQDLNEKGKRNVRSEYFGLNGYYQQFDREYPEELEIPFSRKSFSLVNQNNKIDLTSDGEYYWSIEELKEERKDISSADERLRSKLDIFYSHYLD